MDGFHSVIYVKPPAPGDSGGRRHSGAIDVPPRRPARNLASLVSEPDQLPGSCAICLQEFLHAEELRALPFDGSHVFHPHCLKKWLPQNPVCPMCREDVRPKTVLLDREIAKKVLRSYSVLSEARRKPSTEASGPKTKGSPPRAANAQQR